VSGWDIVGNIIVILSILGWLVFFRSLRKLKQRCSLSGRDRSQQSSQQILGSGVEVRAIEQATARVTMAAPTTCPVCQQHTLDARAKLPLLIGMPFHCRNCGTGYYIDRSDIGNSNLGNANLRNTHLGKYNFFIGLFYVLIMWSVFVRSVWPLVATLGPIYVVLYVLPVAVDSRERNPATDWRLVAVSLILLGLALFGSQVANEHSQSGSRLAADYLATSPIMAQRVGPVVDVQALDFYKLTTDFRVSRGRHMFIVTGERGSENIGVLWTSSNDDEPAFQVDELWLLREDGKAEKIWP
jgi:hypothetical protein